MTTLSQFKTLALRNSPTDHPVDADYFATCYIAGPMSGIPLFNFPYFQEAAAALRTAGWLVFSPAEADIDRGEAPREDGVPPHGIKYYMAHDLPLVCKADALFFLEGWDKSQGAQLEHQVAQYLEIPCYTYETGGRIRILGSDPDGLLLGIDHDELEISAFLGENEHTPEHPRAAYDPDTLNIVPSYPSTREQIERAKSQAIMEMRAQQEGEDKGWYKRIPEEVHREGMCCGDPDDCGRGCDEAPTLSPLMEFIAGDVPSEEPAIDLDALREWAGITPDAKATNPKDAVGSSKIPLHLWPTTASALGAMGLLDGMLKYGRSNWRAAGVRFSIYYDALRRHLDALHEGEDNDPKSGLPHMAHILACAAIIVDAQAAGMLNDDRQYNGKGYRPFMDDLTEHVERLKKEHAEAGDDPYHYTLGD